MQPKVSPRIKILVEACETLGYECENVDPDGNLVEVTDGAHSFHSGTGRVGSYPLNSHSSAELVNDKSWTSTVLGQNGFGVPKGEQFFVKPTHRELRGDGRELEDAIHYAQQLGYPVFVKPNRGSLGILAEADYNSEELNQHLEQIAQKDYIAIVQEMILLPEFRIFAIDGEVQFAYERTPPLITGNGQRTVKDLLAEKNASIKREENKVSEDSSYFVRQLSEAGLTLDSVLKDDQQIRIALKTNVEAGGSIRGYLDEFPDEVHLWTKELMGVLNLRVAGIDTFGRDVNDPDNLIIEVNQNPNLAGIYNLGHEDKVIEVWQKIMEKYFNSFY